MHVLELSLDDRGLIAETINLERLNIGNYNKLPPENEAGCIKDGICGTIATIECRNRSPPVNTFQWPLKPHFNDSI